MRALVGRRRTPGARRPRAEGRREPCAPCVACCSARGAESRAQRGWGADKARFIPAAARLCSVPALEGIMPPGRPRWCLGANQGVSWARACRGAQRGPPARAGSSWCCPSTRASGGFGVLRVGLAQGRTKVPASRMWRDLTPRRARFSSPSGAGAAADGGMLPRCRMAWVAASSKGFAAPTGAAKAACVARTWRSTLPCVWRH